MAVISYSTRENETHAVLSQHLVVGESLHHHIRCDGPGPDGLLYVSGRENFSNRFGKWGVYRFDPFDGKYIDTFIQDGPLNWIDFGLDGNLYAVNSWSDSLVQYDGSTGELVRTVIPGSNFQFGVGTFAIGNRGDVFATTDASMLARYDLATGDRIGPLTDLDKLGVTGT